MSVNWETVLLAGIAAFMGGAITFLASFLERASQERRDRNAKDRLEMAFFQAVHDELETVWRLYTEVIGNQVESLPENTPLLGRWLVSNDYFTAYHSMGWMLGHVRDPDLRAEIISTYTRGKSLLDTYRSHDMMMSNLEQLIQWNQAVNTPQSNQLMTARLQTITQYTASIKGSHVKLRDKVEHLLRELRKKGVLTKAD